MIRFRVQAEDKVRLAGLSIGYVVFENAHAEKDSYVIDEALEAAIAKLRGRFKGTESISEDAVIKAVRKLFSGVGLDPTKERPSGEALIRRAVDGNGLYRINTIVDVNNLISMTTGYPCGVYDLDHIKGTIRILVGRAGGMYIGIGGREMSTENRILTRDDISIFGGPTADSERTVVGLNTKNVLMLIYHPEGAPGRLLGQAMKEAEEKMKEVCSASVRETGTYQIG